MILGFTGTREGMTVRQLQDFIHLLVQLSPTEFHHGGDAGADTQAHRLVRKHLPNCKIVVHPPSNRFHVGNERADVSMPPQDFLVRNNNIVLHADTLAAAPYTEYEQLRSGTWATIRYARKAGKKVHLLPP